MGCEKKKTRLGLRALRRRIQIQGFAAVDMRSAGGKQFFEWKEQLMRDLGGAANLSAQKRALVESASRSMLLLSHVDAYLLAQPCLINKRDRCLVPALLQRQEIATGLTRALSMLGLERVAPPVQSLQEVLAEMEDESDATDPNSKAQGLAGETLDAGDGVSAHVTDAIKDFAGENDEEQV